MDFSILSEKLKLSHVHNVDYDKEQVELFFEDGTNVDLPFDDWFELLDFAIDIIEINKNLCSEKYQD